MGGMGYMQPGMGPMPPGMGLMPPGMGPMSPGMGLPPGMGPMPLGMGGMFPGMGGIGASCAPKPRPQCPTSPCMMMPPRGGPAGMPMPFSKCMVEPMEQMESSDEATVGQPPPCHECSGFAKTPCAPRHPGNSPSGGQADPNQPVFQGVLSKEPQMDVSGAMGSPAIMSMGAAMPTAGRTSMDQAMRAGMPMGGGMPMEGGMPMSGGMPVGGGMPMGGGMPFMSPCMECGGMSLPYEMGGMPLSPCMECGNIPNAPCLPPQGMGMGMGMGMPMSNIPCMECSNNPNAPCNAPYCTKRADTPCLECGGLPNPPCAAESEQEGDYQEIGATMGGNTLTIRVHKDKNKIEQVDPNAPPESDDEDECCCSQGKKRHRKDRSLEMRPGITQGKKELPFGFKVSKSKNAANNVVVNPPVAVAEDGTRFTEFSDPNKELFVLRVGKRSEGIDKKQNLELELCTPRGKKIL